MYNKSKGTGIPSDAQSKEKLAVYVYEYLVHIGAQKTATSFLQEIRWDKGITLGEPPGFLHSWWSVFWDLYSAAPERRDTHEHSSEAKAFHDYGFVNSGYPNGLSHPGHPVISGPGGAGGPGAGPGMPPPLGPPGPESVAMRQRPPGPPMISGAGPPGAGSGSCPQGPPLPHHPSMRFHQPGGGYPGPVGSGMISPHGGLIPSGPGGGPPHPMHGGPMPQPHHHPPGSMIAHPRPSRWVGPPISQHQQGGPPVVVCSGSVGPPVSSGVGPVGGSLGSCSGSGVVPSPGHPGTPVGPQPHLAAPSPSGPQPEYSTRPSPHFVLSGGPGSTTPDGVIFGAGPGDAMLNGGGPPPRGGMMPPPPPDYGAPGMPTPATSSGPYPGSDLKMSPLHAGPGAGDMLVGGPPLMPSDYPNVGNGGPTGNGGNFAGGPDGGLMMPPPHQGGGLMPPQHIAGGPQGGQPPPPPQYLPSGPQPGSAGPPLQQGGGGPANASGGSGGPGSVQFPQEYSFNPISQ